MNVDMNFRVNVHVDVNMNIRKKVHPVLGSLRIKKVTKIGPVQNAGEGSALRINKSTIQNVDFVIQGGGGQIFGFFPNV